LSLPYSISVESFEKCQGNSIFEQLEAILSHMARYCPPSAQLFLLSASRSFLHRDERKGLKS
jgi:hypothetical protein